MYIHILYAHMCIYIYIYIYTYICTYFLVVRWDWLVALC